MRLSLHLIKNDTKRDPTALVDDGDLTFDLHTVINNYAIHANNELETDQDIHQLPQAINEVRIYYT